MIKKEYVFLFLPLYTEYNIYIVLQLAFSLLTIIIGGLSTSEYRESPHPF